jgi:hypothetical protein
MRAELYAFRLIWSLTPVALIRVYNRVSCYSH